MSRHGSFAHILVLLASVGVAGCGEETPSSSGYPLPLRLNPLRLQAASPADSAAAWAMFDRDTTTHWSPATGGADLDITLDAPRALAYLKVFGPGAGALELQTASGDALLALDLSDLRPGWNHIALPNGDAVDRLRLRVAGTVFVPDLELWAYDSPRSPLQTERLLEQIAYSKLEGQADVISAQPARLTLAAGMNESCGDFVFELPRDPSVYRRAWITYGATGLFRPFVVTRSLNDGPEIQGKWLREDTAVGVFVEPIDPERLVAGLNWYQVCVPSGSAGSLVLQDARFVGELDHGTNLVEAAAIGAVGTTPTKPAMFLLDPANPDTQDVLQGQRIVLAFERWISPDAVLLATDRDDWLVECLDAAGVGAPLATEAKADEQRGVALLVKPADTETRCAGLSLQPSGATARVSFLAVAGSGARQRVDWPRIVLASPREHFGRVAWIEGWTTVPASASDEARVEVDGVDTGTTIGVFAQLLQRPGNRSDAWPVTVTARLADGSSVTRQYVLDRYSDQAGRVEEGLGDRGTQLTPEESADRYGVPGQTVEQTTDPDADTSIRLGTHVGVDVPAGANNGPVTITITHLDAAGVPRMDPGVINVTAPADHGYEFTPHGHEFKKAVTVLLPFDMALLPPGYTADDVNAYYFDTDAQRWKRLARVQVDPVTGTTRSDTDHFTTMINAVVVAPEHPNVTSFNPTQISGIHSADPGSRVNLIDPPGSSPQGGTSLSYAFDVPPGRGGMQPQLALSYDSGRANGWLGVGWDLPMPAIGIETRWGAPRYDPAMETETYTLDGSELTPVAHRGAPRSRASGTVTINGEAVKIFHMRVEGSFHRIIRHGNHPNNYWWEVIDKTGTRSFYGGDPDTGGPTSDSTLMTASGNVFLWGLRETRDTDGNASRYCTERVSDVGLAAGTVPGFELYLSSIDYTRDPGGGHTCSDADRGPYRLKFLRDSHVGAPRRPDVQIDGMGGFKRVTAQRLRRVELYFRNVLVRAWDLDYDIGAFHKSRLISIRQFGVGNTPFPGNVHEFEYFDDVRPNPAAPTSYDGFAPAHDWSVTDDDIDSGLIVPSFLFDLIGPGEPSLLGGGTAKGGGGHIYIGFNPFSPGKTNSFGGKLGFNVSEAKGVAAFIDIDGDGLSDKVFKTSSGFRFRRNESGPEGEVRNASGDLLSGDASFSGDMFSLPGLGSVISRDNTFMFSAGFEVYPLVFGLIFNHSESFTRTSTYVSDVNGDGLSDLVSNGQVLFNRRTSSGGQEFVSTSTGTPFPIIPGTVETDGILPDYGDVLDQANDSNPLDDSVRFWVSPMFGFVNVTAPVNLVRESPDGVRVSIQHNSSVLWSQVIAGNDLSVKNPTGVSSLFVFPGDHIYFRVQSRDSGKDDEVAWNPSISYTDPPALDANGLDVTEYSASGDFILGGRPGISTLTPFDGTVRLLGTLNKLRATSDDINVQIRKNGVAMFSESRAWNSTTAILIDSSFTVNRDDDIELLVRSDSQIDLTALDFNPVVEMTYTSAFDTDGDPVTVTDSDGNSIYKVFVPYDMDSYFVRIPTGLPTPWVAPGDPGDAYTVPIKVTVTLPFFGGEGLTFTTKRQNELVRKHTFFPNFGLPQTFSFDLDVVAGQRLFFDFHTRDRNVAFGSFTDVVIDLGFIEIPLPHASYTVTIPDLCSRPYRGWSYAGYVPPDPDNPDDPIRHSGAEAFCTIDSDFDEDTDLPDNRGDLEAGVDNLDDSVTRAFAPYPGGRDCVEGSDSCQIPDGPLWGGPGELSYITGGLMSSSRLGAPEVVVPSPGDIAGAGANAVARLSRTSENAFSVSGGVGPVSGSFSISDGNSTGEVDYMDMNGDRFPDVVSHAGVQYTDPRGTLAERRPVLSNVRESDSVAYSAGIGGNVATSVANGRGRFGPTATSSGTTAENGSQMAELGFSLDANGNISTNDVNSELMDINGDGLPDRLTRDGGTLRVAFNLGYEFAPSEPWGSSTISTGNGFQFGGGAGFSFNDGNYGFGGGINGAHSEQQINETVPLFQRDGQSLLDVNGDGLIDHVVADGGTLDVRFNTGNGFAGGSSYNGLQGRDTVENKSSTIGAGGYFTISIGPLCIAACYLIINPGADVNESLNRPEVVLQDVNGDGYADHLVSEEDGELTASLNNHGRTNLLKRVDRPMHGWFEVDYERKGNTFEDPNSHWVLSSMVLFDGLAGDGTDYHLKTFTYGPGNYDRFERDFYGFSEAEEIDHDTTGIAPNVLLETPEVAPVYRKTRREFHNDSYFTKGMLRRETVIGLDTGSELVYRVNENDYLLREVDSGLETTDPTVLRFTLSSVFPQLQSTTARYSEGDPSIALVTQTFMTYDQFGNTATLIDTGDVGSGDDYTAVITYTGAAGGRHESCADGYIVGNADSIVVRNAAGAVLRQRTGDYDCSGGDLIRVEHVTDTAGGTAASNFAYAPNGNLTQVMGPPSHAGDRYALTITYDDDIQTHVKTVTDSFGYVSETQYDLRFGEPSSITDQNGNTITRTYDDFGRSATVTGPYEQGTGYATMTFEYHPDATVPWARTKNLDPFRDLADPIETIIFTDGIKRVVQTKKDITEHQGSGGAAIDKMSISGLQTSDFVGRLIEKFHPTVEAKNDTLNEQYAPTPDMVDPLQKDYDVLDRMTHSEYPDHTTVSQAYTLAADRHGTLRAALTETDQLFNQNITYSDVREQVVAVQQFNTTKGEVIWTEYAYSPMQEAVQITDDHGNVTTLEYDLLGRRTVVDSPDSGRIEMAYDPADNMVRKVVGHVGAAGAAVTYEYDHNRVVAVNYPLFPENNVTYTYGGTDLRGMGGNRVGRLTRVTDESGVEDREYGKLGELTEETKTLASDTLGACAGCPEVWTTQYVYDTWGRLQQMTYPDTEVLTYSYDSGGLVRAVAGVKLTEEYSYVTRLEYDKFGNRAFMEYGNGVKSTYSYDPANRRLTNLEAGTFQKLVYEYDDIGNVTHLTNDVPPGHPNEMGGPVDQVYEYDSLYRLTHANGTFRYGPLKTDAYDLELDYDTIHNILSKDQNHTVQTKTNKPIEQHKTTYNWTYEYSAAQPHAPSRIAGAAAPGFEDRAFFYDASGNQLGWDDLTSGQRRTIVWDEENRIQSIADNGRTTRFKYDDTGQRVIKRGAQGETAYINQFWTVRNRSVGTKHIFVGESRLVSKLSPGDRHVNPGDNDPFMRMVGHWADTGLDAPGRRVGWRLPDDNFLYWYHSDHLGSTGWVTNPDGELYEHVEYFPFGETWVAEDSNTERMPYLFTSKELDQETELYYFGARYYDPKTSVWQSSDPEIADEPGAAIGNPMVLAAYTYTAQNPLRLIDPDGRSWLSSAAKWITTTDLGIVEYIPYVGTAIDVARVAAYTYQGDYVNAGITAATVAAGLIPGGGAAAKVGIKAGKAIAKEAAQQVAKKVVKEAAEEGAEQVVKKVTKEAPVIIGENMKRVNKYAKEHGGETIDDWLKAKGKTWTKELNDEFIDTMKKQGKKFDDIGPDFNRRLKNRKNPADPEGRPPSKDYGKEREQLKDYNNYERKYDRSGRYEGGELPRLPE